jgi:hypothetical protein
MLDRGLGTSTWSEKHVDVRPIQFAELPMLGEPTAKDGNLTAWIVHGTRTPPTKRFSEVESVRVPE